MENIYKVKIVFMKMKTREYNTQLKIVSILFFIVALIFVLILIFLIFFSQRFETLSMFELIKYQGAGNQLIVYAFVLFFASFFYFYEGLVLWQKKYTNVNFWFGLFLSIMLLFGFPLGTLLGAVTSVLILKNRKLFSDKS